MATDFKVDFNVVDSFNVSFDNDTFVTDLTTDSFNVNFETPTPFTVEFNQQGAQGPAGDDAVAVLWTSTFTFREGEFARNADGVVYISLQNNNTNRPLDSEDWWNQVSFSSDAISIDSDYGITLRDSDNKTFIGVDTEGANGIANKPYVNGEFADDRTYVLLNDANPTYSNNVGVGTGEAYLVQNSNGHTLIFVHEPHLQQLHRHFIKVTDSETGDYSIYPVKYTNDLQSGNAVEFVCQHSIYNSGASEVNEDATTFIIEHDSDGSGSFSIGYGLTHDENDRISVDTEVIADTEWVKDNTLANATVADDTLTITRGDGTTVEFEGGSGGGVDYGYQNLFTDSTELQRFPTTHDVGHNHFASDGTDIRWYLAQETVFDTDLPVGATIKVNFVSANPGVTPSQEGYYSIFNLEIDSLDTLYTLNLEHIEGDDPLASRPNAEDDTNHYTIEFSSENRAAGRSFNGHRTGYVPAPSGSERNNRHFLDGTGGFTKIDSEIITGGDNVTVTNTDAGVSIAVDVLDSDGSTTFAVESISVDDEGNRILFVDSDTVSSIRVDTEQVMHIPRREHLSTNLLTDADVPLAAVNFNNNTNPTQVIFFWTEASMGGPTAFDETFISFAGVNSLRISGDDFTGELDVSGEPDGSEFVGGQLAFHYDIDKFTGTTPDNRFNTDNVQVYQSNEDLRLPSTRAFRSDKGILFPDQNDNEGQFTVNVDTEVIADTDWVKANTLKNAEVADNTLTITRGDDTTVEFQGGGSHARSVYIEAADGDRSPLVYIKHNTNGTVDVHTVDSEYAGIGTGELDAVSLDAGGRLTIEQIGQNQSVPFDTSGEDVYVVTDTYTVIISGSPDNTGNDPVGNRTLHEWDNTTIVSGSSTDYSTKSFSNHTLVSIHTGKLGFTMADTDWIHTNTQSALTAGDGININNDTEIEVDDGYGLNFDSNRQLQVDLSQIASKSYVQSAVRNATRGEIGEKTDEHTLYLADTEHDQLRFLNDAGVSNNRSFIVNTRGATVYQGIAANDDDLKVVQATDGGTETVNANASRNWEAVSYNVYEGNKWDDADALTYTSRAFKYNGDAPTHIWNSQESTFANVSFFRNGHNSSSLYQVTARVQLVVVDELEQIRLHDGPQLVAQSDEFEIDLPSGQTQVTESPVRLPSVSESQGTQIHPGQYVALRWACHIDHYDDNGITLTDAPYLVWSGTSGTQTHHAGRADVRTVTYELYLEAADGNQYGRLKYGNNTTTPEGIHTIIDTDGQAPYLKVGGGDFASIHSDSGGAVAIGPNASSEANNGVVIGNGANNEGTSGVAIGTSTHADLANAVAIGAGARAGTVGASGGMMTAVGNDSRATGDRGVAIGHDAWSVGGISIAIGDNARADHTYGIAIGGGARTSANFQMVIANIRDIRVTDNLYSPDSDLSLVTRGWAEENIGGSPYIEVGPTNGADAVATDTDSFAFGGGATTNTATRSFAIGGNSIVRADAANGVAIGYESIAASNAIAIGRAMADTDFATAIGWNAGGYGAGSNLSFAMGHRSTAIGAFSRTLGADSVAIGVAAQSDGDNSVALGRFANSDGSHSVAIGRNTEAEGLSSIAIGGSTTNDDAANAHGPNSIAIGRDTFVNHSNGVAIGHGSETTANNQVSFQGGFLDYLVLPSAGGDPVGAPNGSIYLRTSDNRVRVLTNNVWVNL